MSNTTGNNNHYDEALIETERASEREGGPELSVARPSSGDFREFHMPVIPSTEPQTPEELEEARNPLGYNASEPTREELEEDEKQPVANR